MLKLFFRFLFWVVCSLFLILFAVTIARAQAGPGLTNTFNVAQFQGGDVASKIIAAQNACLADVNVPCILIIDPILAVWPTGTLPTRCAQCTWIDYRTAGSLVLGVSALNAQTIGGYRYATNDGWACDGAT